MLREPASKLSKSFKNGSGRRPPESTQEALKGLLTCWLACFQPFSRISTQIPPRSKGPLHSAPFASVGAYPPLHRWGPKATLRKLLFLRAAPANRPTPHSRQQESSRPSAIAPASQSISVNFGPLGGFFWSNRGYRGPMGLLYARDSPMFPLMQSCLLQSWLKPA